MQAATDNRTVARAGHPGMNVLLIALGVGLLCLGAVTNAEALPGTSISIITPERLPVRVQQSSVDQAEATRKVQHELQALGQYRFKARSHWYQMRAVGTGHSQPFTFDYGMADPRLPYGRPKGREMMAPGREFEW